MLIFEAIRELSWSLVEADAEPNQWRRLIRHSVTHFPYFCPFGCKFVPFFFPNAPSAAQHPVFQRYGSLIFSNVKFSFPVNNYHLKADPSHINFQRSRNIFLKDPDFVSCSTFLQKLPAEFPF